MRPHSTGPMQIRNGAFSQRAAIVATISVTASWFCSTITFPNTSLSDFPPHLAPSSRLLFYPVLYNFILHQLLSSYICADTYGHASQGRSLEAQT